MDQRSGRGGNRTRFRGNFKKGRSQHHRGNRHGSGGRGRGFSSNKNINRSNHITRDDTTLQKPEQLAEIEVGITEYVSALEGFSAVIKSRYSDFHVNEIDVDGKVVKLTDTKMPKEFQILPVDIPAESPLPEISKEQWQEINDIIQSSDDSLFVKIDVTNGDKETRSSIHKTLKAIFQKKIISNTIEEDDKKFIQVKKTSSKNKSSRPDQWPAQLPIYTHFLMYKESIDTMNAIMSISDALYMNSTAFHYAGVKDRRAKTTQWISCKKVEPSKLLFRTKHLRNIKIGNIAFKDAPLALGQLNGNLFRLALRDVTVDDDIIDAHCQQLNEHGFVNYYGLQRFGNDKTVPTYLIGAKLLQGNFKEACKLILKPKNYDNPSAEISQAKKIYAETQNAQEAVTKLSVNHSLESKLLFGLSKYGRNDFVNALECIPRNMRLMYIHSFQSFIWNFVVSKRIKEFGLKPVIGDLVCLEEPKESFELLDDVKGVEDMEDVKNIEEANADAETDGNQEKEGCIEDKKLLVKVLTEDDLADYNIYDIVLPLPGYNVTYPEHLKSYYTELLEEYNLDLEMPKQRVKCYTLCGNYRKIVMKPAELAWHTIKYTDPHATLIRSDFEEILNHKEPQSDPDGKFKGLVMSFKLQPSSYATMVLREVLRIDTSAQNQSKLNHPCPEKKQQEEEAEKKEEIHMETEGSMLHDKDKFDAFKKLIEGSCDDDEEIRALIKRPAEDEHTVSKKAKLDVDVDDDDDGIKIQPSLV